MQESRQKARAEDRKAARGRGRPREFDREAALAQATRLFWSRGFEATSISDLTKAMGIGSPSLYAAFGSKEALYAEALRYYRENYETLFWGNFHSAATAREAVQSLLMDFGGGHERMPRRHSERMHGGALVGRQRGSCRTRRVGACRPARAGWSA